MILSAVVGRAVIPGRENKANVIHIVMLKLEAEGKGEGASRKRDSRRRSRRRQKEIYIWCFRVLEGSTYSSAAVLAYGANGRS